MEFLFCGFDTLVKNANELIDFVEEFSEEIWFVDKRDTLSEFEPTGRFPKFFERDSKFVNEVLR